VSSCFIVGNVGTRLRRHRTRVRLESKADLSDRIDKRSVDVAVMTLDKLGLTLLPNVPIAQVK